MLIVRNNLQLKGVTMVELVITIVILSIALLGVVSMYSKAIERSADPLIYAKSIELGQTFMDEILTKRFDELSPVGGVPMATTLTAAGSFGEEGSETRATFDDVDDYHNETYTSVQLITGDSDGVDQYVNYSVSVTVSYVNVSSELTGLGIPGNQSVKRIDVVVNNPLSRSLTFTAYKGNF